MINIVGLGYIGLPTALMLSAHGAKVIGTDYSDNVITSLMNGDLTFEEKGLRELYSKAVKNNISFTSEYIKTDIYIIAVATPYNKFSKKIDTSYVISALHSILEICENDSIIIIESTVSPGTIDRYLRPIVDAQNKRISLVHAPERIIPGNMIYELEHNARTIGADDYDVGIKVKNIYSTFCKGSIAITDLKSAEMTKVVENTYRAVNIAFANELLKICRQDDMDVNEIIRICNMHPRVNILSPGPGVGGHCISVDPWFLVGDYPSLTNVIAESMKVNDSMPAFVLGRINEIMEELNFTDISRVGLYGLSYKENVDDYRESPSLQLLEMQKKHLAEPLKVYDPYIKSKICENQYFSFDEFLNDTDFIVVMIAHDQLKQNINEIQNKIVLDTRNIAELKKCYKL